MKSEDVLGLIAGEGRLPFLVAAGAKRAGIRVICVALAGNAEAGLEREVDVFYKVAIARPGSWIRKLRRHRVTKAIMVGRVAKGRIYTPWRIIRYLPDWRAFRIWYWRLRGRNKQTDNLLNALADELAGGGIILGNSTMYCKDHLATTGVMTRQQPSSSVRNDIEFGWQIAKKLGELDIGQAVAVKEREVIAVEAIEGTAEMIERAGKLCKLGGWTLIKTSKPKQDERFDVPCVGMDTIRSLARNGGKCLVVEAGRTIIIDKSETIKLAEELGVAIIGVKSPEDISSGKPGSWNLFSKRNFMSQVHSEPRSVGRYLRINSGSCVGVLDRFFCRRTQAFDFARRIDALMAQGQVLKEGETSCVCRINWNNQNVVVKRYNNKGLVHSLRHTIKGSRARRGWMRGHQLRMLRIATPQPLAYVEYKKGPVVYRSYLVTENVQGRNLQVFLQDENTTEKQGEEAIRRVAQLLNKFEEHRITHGDLKHTNILITDGEVFITDLDAMAMHTNQLFYRNRRKKDLKRFLKKANVPATLKHLFITLTAENKKPAEKRTEDFEKMRLGNWLLQVRKGLPRSVAGDLLSIADAPAGGGDQFVKVPSSDYTAVFRRRILVNGNEHTVYLKRYLNRSILDLVKYLFRTSRARRAFEAAIMLKTNGFDTPAAIGFFERYKGPFLADNFLVTEDVESSVSLYEHISQLRNRTDEAAQQEKPQLISSFGEIVGRMHAAGIFHGDLRLNNVLVGKEDEQWLFVFIDNERTKKFRRLPEQLRIKNLVQVNMLRPNEVTGSDRMRFLTAYLNASPCYRKSCTSLARKIVAKTRRRLLGKEWFTNDAQTSRHQG